MAHPPQRDDGGDAAGEAYVLFGSAFGFGTVAGGRQVIDLTTLSASQGFIIQGDTSGDVAGLSVSSAGDVNGDGLADLIVGASGDDGGSLAGEAYVLFGTASGFGSPIGGRQVIDLILSLHRDHGSTLLLVTHDPALAAHAERIITLRDGRIESDLPAPGGPSRVASRPRSSGERP